MDPEETIIEIEIINKVIEIYQKLMSKQWALKTQ